MFLFKRTLALNWYNFSIITIRPLLIIFLIFSFITFILQVFFQKFHNINNKQLFQRESLFFFIFSSSSCIIARVIVVYSWRIACQWVQVLWVILGCSAWDWQSTAPRPGSSGSSAREAGRKASCPIRHCSILPNFPKIHSQSYTVIYHIYHKQQQQINTPSAAK